jgi:hypothetical protein
MFQLLWTIEVDKLTRLHNYRSFLIKEFINVDRLSSETFTYSSNFYVEQLKVKVAHCQRLCNSFQVLANLHVRGSIMLHSNNYGLYKLFLMSCAIITHAKRSRSKLTSLCQGQGRLNIHIFFKVLRGTVEGQGHTCSSRSKLTSLCQG